MTVASDLGNLIQLAGGVARDDRLIDSPPGGIATGDLVRIVAAGKATP